MILSKNILNGVGEKRQPWRTPMVGRNQAPGVIHDDCAGGLVIKMFDDSDKVDTNIVFLHGCPKGCTHYPVKSLHEVNVDIIEIFLMLHVLLRWYLEHGLVVTRVYQVIEYDGNPCFRRFGDSVSAARRDGDAYPPQSYHHGHDETIRNFGLPEDYYQRVG